MKNFISIFLFFVVFSHSNNKIRLYDIIHKSIDENDDQLLLKIQISNYLSSTKIPPITQQRNSMKNKEENKIYVRDIWDPDDDYYFKWATFNRRPMESLAGRK